MEENYIHLYIIANEFALSVNNILFPLTMHKNIDPQQTTTLSKKHFYEWSCSQYEIKK